MKKVKLDAKSKKETTADEMNIKQLHLIRKLEKVKRFSMLVKVFSIVVFISAVISVSFLILTKVFKDSPARYNDYNNPNDENGDKTVEPANNGYPDKKDISSSIKKKIELFEKKIKESSDILAKETEKPEQKAARVKNSSAANTSPKR